MAAPSEKEMQLLEKFRENVSDLDLNKDQLAHMFLLSWIRARENDLRKAEDMLRRSLQWRIANDMEGVLDWAPPEHFPAWCPYELTGLDNDGRPVVVIPIGTWDVRTLIESGHRAAYIRYVDQFFMRVMKYMKDHCSKSGQTQFTTVVDLKGFGMRQITSPSAVDAVLETFKRFEANFPETLRTAFIINAPRIFPMAFAVVKPLLSGRTLQKIKIFASNESKWKPAILASIPAETIPIVYGGTHPAFTNIVSGTSNPIVKSGIEDGYMKADIEAGGKFVLEYPIQTAGTCVSWEFSSGDYDIGFSVSCDGKDVIPYKRCESHLRKESGTLICSSPGKYALVFDNSYSRMRGKTLNYLVTVDGEHLEIEENNNEVNAF